MPHAVEQSDLEADQELELIKAVINEDRRNGGLDFLTRELDVGEKADDAEDFEDIGDDDLPDEEDATNKVGPNDDAAGDFGFDAGLFSEIQEDQREGDEFDDLFGDQPSSPAEPVPTAAETGLLLPGPAKKPSLTLPQAPGRLTLPGSLPKRTETERDIALSTQPTFRDFTYGTTTEKSGPAAEGVAPTVEEEDEEENEEWLEQQRLFAQARGDLEAKMRGYGDIPPPPQTDTELFQTIWPHFERDKPPAFMELLPTKRAFYLGKTPLKPPKPIQPTKVNLELLPDQEKSFKLPAAPTSTKAARQAGAEQRGLVIITEAEAGETTSDDEMELDTLDEEMETVGGVSWNDLNVICESWDIPTLESLSDDDDAGSRVELRQREDGGWMLGGVAPPAKKRRTGHLWSIGQLPIYNDALPSFDDPEVLTSKLSRKIILDLNDPNLLLDIQEPSTGEKRTRNATSTFRRDVSGSLTKTLTRRFNISNDEAYDALKENHQHKVRSTLGTISVEHGLPALKLQYPFYKVKLEPREARSFHRPPLHVKANERVMFSKPKRVKKEDRKGKNIQTLFAEAKDLTLADNSSMLLLEYSEEYPMMLSNLGMGNRLVNYYRKKNAEDLLRPKLDLGETAVLLPQDKSPFSIFGDVEPGATVPTLHNALFRAPVFRHTPKQTDFLVCRSTTGIHGTNWYLRNIENLMVVGQEFPSQEVPGTHSRKVTDASKKRLKTIAYRIYKRNAKLQDANKHRGALLSNNMMLAHHPGTELSQLRSRMREFMTYDRDNGGWIPGSEKIPDANVYSRWITPEDVCLLDSMQVGHQQLQDAGYNKADKVGEGEERDEDNNADDASLEQQLAPWQLTKNFIHACEKKAMLELHGAGDPSGRGEAFSFIKTSMKGGFKAIGESIEDRLDAARLKELGGHTYNVARQQKAYDDAIKRIWNAQAQSLSSTLEHSDIEMDVDNAEENGGSFTRGKTPRSEFGTPAASHRDDETTSQFSRMSTASQRGKVLKISRRLQNQYGKTADEPEIVTDPRVIREYVKRKRARELENMNLAELQPTGDPEHDRMMRAALEEELARLRRNQERRFVREKAKGIYRPPDNSTPATPGGPGANTPAPSGKAAGTQRRCANCGQVGHIKTNKKLCPLLNGEWAKNGTGFDDSAFAASTANPSVAATPAAPSAGSPP